LISLTLASLKFSFMMLIKIAESVSKAFQKVLGEEVTAFRS